MPPLYHWTCKDCDTHVEVVRHFSEYEQPPKAEELEKPKGKGAKKKRECKHQNWERLIGQDIRAFRSIAWGAKGRKGYW